MWPAKYTPWANLFVCVLLVVCCTVEEPRALRVNRVLYDYYEAYEPVGGYYLAKRLSFSIGKGVAVGTGEFITYQPDVHEPDRLGSIASREVSITLYEKKGGYIAVESASFPSYEWPSKNIEFSDGTICSQTPETGWLCRDLNIDWFYDNEPRSRNLSSSSLTTFTDQYGFIDFPQFDGASYVSDYCGLFGAMGKVTCYYLGARSTLANPVTETSKVGDIIQFEAQCCFEIDSANVYLYGMTAPVVLPSHIFMLTKAGKVYFAGSGIDLTGLGGPSVDDRFIPITQAVELPAIAAAIKIVSTGLALCWLNSDGHAFCYKYKGLEAGGTIISPQKLQNATEFYTGSGILCADTPQGLVCGVWPFSDHENWERDEYMSTFWNTRKQYCEVAGIYCGSCMQYKCEKDTPLDWQWDR